MEWISINDDLPTDDKLYNCCGEDWCGYPLFYAKHDKDGWYIMSGNDRLRQFPTHWQQSEKAPATNEALDKAMEMLTIPMKDLPEPAKEYLKHLSSSLGMCIEVCITAYAHYNQAVLNMSCNDDLYQMDNLTKQWFKDRNYCS